MPIRVKSHSPKGASCQPLECELQSSTKVREEEEEERIIRGWTRMVGNRRPYVHGQAAAEKRDAAD
jgi:hypothetical protein